jgi:hypothetical protein
MRTANNLAKIESQIMNLPVADQIHLIERIARLIRSEQMKPGTVNDLNDLYGAGKGIWGNDDAQEYVNRARDERT